jgi:hypothetical protein
MLLDTWLMNNVDRNRVGAIIVEINGRIFFGRLGGGIMTSDVD